ncbi:MAG: FMN-binding protein [Bacillota bacterium]|nr:FMN-binding protein [Bacillota bacterium]
MKKGRKVLLKWIIVLVVFIVGVKVFMNQQLVKTYQRLDAVNIADVSNVEDGTYEGIQETPLVKVTVEVSVKDHQITDIRLLRHENGNGAPAEAMIPVMIQKNTSEVDEVSGATMSSKTIKAAVRNALEKGEIKCKL